MSDQLSFDLPEELDRGPDTGELPAVAALPVSAGRTDAAGPAHVQPSLFDAPGIARREAPPDEGALPPEPDSDRPPSDVPEDIPPTPPTEVASDEYDAGIDGTAPDDADDQPAPRRRRDSTLLWVGTGATLGLVALIAFGGGLGSDPPPSDPRAASTGERTAPATTATAAGGRTAPTTTTPTAGSTGDAGAAAGLDVVLQARAGRSVYVQVRRRDASGAELFAGTLTSTSRRRLRTDGTPLWVNVAWAPNLVVTVNGNRVASPGGTVVYEITRQGVRTLDDPYADG